MEQSLEKYSKMPVSKAVIQNALPAVAAMLMVLIYNLADTFFIGRTQDAYQVAAVSLATPVFLAFMSIGTIFGVGGTSVISRAYGEGKKEYAKKICSFCMWSCIAIGILLTIGFLWFMEPLLKLIGASEDTWEYTKTYLTIVSFSGTFALISSCFSNILRAEGQATKAMNGQLIGNILNMALDAVFIMAFHWDIAGCALATLLGEMLGAVYYLHYYLTGKSALSIHIKDFTLKDKVAGGIEGVLCNNDSMAMGAVQACINNGYNSGDAEKFVPIVGIDANIDALEAMKAGSLLGTVLNDRKSQSDAIINVIKAVHAGTEITEDVVGVNCTVDGKYVWVPYVIVDESNLSATLEDMLAVAQSE